MDAPPIFLLSIPSAGKKVLSNIEAPWAIYYSDIPISMTRSMKIPHSDSSGWADAQPISLLSMPSAVKRDLRCSLAETVFKAQLRLPGQYITPTSTLSDYDWHEKQTKNNTLTIIVH
ncbi:unnamed protein product [Mesocestoides corti]|uniref:Uncharacterized protein n=1 Tax=Mesocestoides corti TaxID=53468 RepID=A0A0R3U6C0_MESCO|nr:unnamed protein product [Mesocestoides corti]